MKPVDIDVVSIGKLIEDPQHAVHFKPHGHCEVAKPSIAGEKSPPPRLGKRKGKRVGRGQMGTLPPDRGCAAEFCRRQFLDPKPTRREAVSEIPGQLSNEEQVGDRELKRETKQVLEQVTPLQIDQNRGVGDEDWQLRSSRNLIQPGIQLADRDAKQFGRPRLTDDAFSQRAIA
jgi:hypothetical protein